MSKLALLEYDPYPFWSWFYCSWTLSIVAVFLLALGSTLVVTITDLLVKHFGSHCGLGKPFASSKHAPHLRLASSSTTCGFCQGGASALRSGSTFGPCCVCGRCSLERGAFSRRGRCLCCHVAARPNQSANKKSPPCWVSCWKLCCSKAALERSSLETTPCCASVAPKCSSKVDCLPSSYALCW